MNEPTESTEPAEPTETGEIGEPGLEGPDGMDALREAAGAVLASLKQLIDAAEQVVADPQSFDRMVSSGRGIVEAFTAGFLDDGTDATGDDPAEETPDRTDPIA